MRVTFNQNPFTNNFYNEKPKENALLMDKRKVSRTVVIRINCLSCPFRSPQQCWDLRVRLWCPSQACISGFNGSLSHQQLLYPLSKRFPQYSAPKHPALCLFMLPESSGSFLLRMTLFNPYVTFLQALRLYLSVKGRTEKNGSGRRRGHPASLLGQGSTSCWKHWWYPPGESLWGFSDVTMQNPYSAWHTTPSERRSSFYSVSTHP